MLEPVEMKAVKHLMRDKASESYGQFIGRIVSAPGGAGELAREVKR